MANTGYKKYNTLLRVVDGGIHDGEPLDQNGELVSISGLPQDSKNNIDTDPDYVEPIYDPIDCPLPRINLDLNYILDILETANVDIEEENNETIYSEIINNSSDTTQSFNTSITGTLNIIITNLDATIELEYFIMVNMIQVATGIIGIGDSATINVTKGDLSIELFTVRG